MIALIVEPCPRGGGQVLGLCFRFPCAASSLICELIHCSRKGPLLSATKKQPWLIVQGQEGKIFRNQLYKHPKRAAHGQSGIVFPRRSAEIDVFNLLSQHLLPAASAGKQSVDTGRRREAIRYGGRWSSTTSLLSSWRGSHLEGLQHSSVRSRGELCL